MIQKKICMLGGFAVGKTSLVSRFVSSIFSDKYHTTVGVKVDRKPVKLGDTEMNLLLWDLYGDDDFQKMRASYLRGSAGYLLVVDGTRAATLDTAISLQQLAESTIGKVPFVLALNKSDLDAEWQLDQAAILKLAKQGWKIIRTSAKTGAGVEDTFVNLARDMLNA